MELIFIFLYPSMSYNFSPNFFKYLQVVNLKEWKKNLLDGTTKTCFKYKVQANNSMTVFKSI